MPSLLSSAVHLLFLSSFIQAHPVSPQPGNIVKYGRHLGRRRDLRLSVVNKRSEAGPEMGDTNFPDPSINLVDNTWYAFATGGNGKNIQIATSPDFDTWTLSGDDALPDVTAATWVDQSAPATWAPDVVQVVSCTATYFGIPSRS